MVQLISKKRAPAQKVWIADFINGNFFAAEGWNPSYVLVNDKKISRANILATVVMKFTSEDGNYAALTLDDGTETIRSKAFGPDTVKFSNVKISSIVRFIGKIKEYNQERYLKPEIVREVSDPNWLIVHKLELGEPATSVPSPEETKPTISENVAETTLKEDDLSVQAKILNLIRTLDSGAGAELDAVIERSQIEIEEAKNIIVGLLKAGEVYEPRKGKLKVLD